jgi:hypothetical protein
MLDQNLIGQKMFKNILKIKKFTPNYNQGYFFPTSDKYEMDLDSFKFILEDENVDKEHPFCLNFVVPKENFSNFKWSIKDDLKAYQDKLKITVSKIDEKKALERINKVLC